MSQMTVQQTIAKQLAVSRVNGFPFFAYTGIKDLVASGDDTLLMMCPKNPNGIKSIWIKLNVMDTYDLEFWSMKKKQVVKKPINGIYNDMMSEIIVREMGVL